MIEQFIANSPGCSHKDLLAVCTGCKKNFYYRVKHLADEGKIYRVRNEQSNNGVDRSYRYYPISEKERKAIEEGIPTYRPLQTLHNPAYVREVVSVFNV